MFRIINCRTGQTVGKPYATRKRALYRATRLGPTYIVRAFPLSENPYLLAMVA